MYEMTSNIDPDELMDLDEAEGSDLDEEDEELIDEPLPSPMQLPSSGPGSTATSTASSPPNNEDIPMHYNYSGKPLSIKRGRGRPRREGGKPLPRKQALGTKLKKWKPTGVYVRGNMPKRVKSFDRSDFDFNVITPSPGEEMTMLDPETGTFIFTDREKVMPAPEELPYAPEQWPGKVCAFCNLGERSQLGQGEMLRLTCPEGFTPQRVIPEQPELPANVGLNAERESGEKSPRGGPVTCRRQKSFNKCRHPSMTSEYVDELTIIGYTEEPDINTLFESAGYFYVHRNCALWSHGVTKMDNGILDNVGHTLLYSSSKKCSHCTHYGASVVCKADGCNKAYHYPCATASGAFQELSSLNLFCSQHLGQAASHCEASVCYTCKILGDIANLMYCSVCGEHYHGTCVGLAQLPGVRAGWQCRRCKICQVCRMSGDETKLMACEQCDKVYHAMCQRPVVTSIPKYGWKCRCCRVCGDCGSRTPGAGLSSRWHAHYTVCDSCYQQRNKGFSCPLCHRAYRAHAHREMVQCSLCRKFVHGSCDPEADLVAYHQRKEAHPEYEYVCLMCKNLTQPGRQLLPKRNSIDECTDSLSASQESLYDESAEYEMDRTGVEDSFRSIGLGKGKPYSASKIAKKRLGLGSIPGRPKGVGKGMPGKMGFMKRQRMTEFGRKRGPKTKMRGIFGVPGVGLQRPVSDGSKGEDEPGIENRLVLCSAKDKFVLTQDICVMCGALGTDHEGCLIACVQCGQCYHPYCVNVKVTKVILQKGWRCLDCTVCEGCGQRNDEARLILCDDCDISFHIYCMDPPLDYVPHGNWKCKWCAICQTCGATDPGFNCNWMNSFTECGPCASHVTCPSCLDVYCEGDLIIQCVQCERWLHGACDSIKTEMDAEKCAEEGYNCLICRPRDVPPPHMLPKALSTFKPPTPTKSPEIKSNINHCVDGVYLSDSGYHLIKSLSLEQQVTRKKRKKLPPVHDKEAGIMATIESVVAGSSMDNSFEDNAKLELVDVKEEPQEIYKEGMIWTKEDGPPPEGFTVYTMESGVSVLRRKRQRNLQKLGIGGFLVRVRGIRGGQENDDVDMLPGQTTPTGTDPPILSGDLDKPRRKPVRRKPKSKLVESFPPYLQEAFFGKELMDSHKELDSTSSDEENAKLHKDKDKTIQLSLDEIKAVAAVSAKQEKPDQSSAISLKEVPKLHRNKTKEATLIPKEEDESDTDLKDVLALPGDLLDTDLVNTIMNEDDDELTKNTDTLEALTGDSNLPDDADLTPNTSKDTKDELSDILGSHFNLEAIPNINSKDVEDIFKGVLTDESQESQESNTFSMQTPVVFGANAVSQSSSAVQQQHPPIGNPLRPTTLPTVNQSSLNSPMSFPPQSPYHSEYSNSPQFSPAFSEPPSPWVSVNDPNELDNSASMVPSTYNQRSSEKMKADEGLGNGATISAVLYANMNHPEWKTDHPLWSDRYKQIIKKWRTLSTEQKAPYLQQARDNRSALRMKKQQQINGKESASATVVTKPGPSSTPVSSAPSIQAPVAPPAAVSEVCTHQLRPTPTLTTASTSSVSVSPPPPSNTPFRPAQSPPTQHQFTVHGGHFLGPGDRCHGPAPNVTVNPLYQQRPTGADQQESPSLPSRPAAPPPTAAADQQIRVLTPSEIMRTLPSLCQENYEPQSLDQEKLALQQKSAREAEQERQWKQLQAMRQQQAQQQQHIIHDQRAQAIARVQRQITDSGQAFMQEQTNAAAAALQSPTNNKPPQAVTPQPSFHPSAFAHQPPTPRPQQFPAPLRPTLQGFTGGAIRQQTDAPEVNRQLRDLLQRQQQFKKLDEQLLPGKGQQRVWPPTEQDQEQTSPTVQTTSSGDTTFRHPLPPAITRPRIPVTPVLRQPSGGLGMRMQVSDIKMQGLDPRMRLLIQQQQHRVISPLNVQQQFQGGTVSRYPHTQSVRPASVEQYEQLLQRQQQQQATPFQPNRSATEQLGNRMQLTQSTGTQRTAPLGQQSPAISVPTSTADASNNEQEIPDNVTAELEKLEQETGTMVELQGVSDILGGLGDDDDELLAEMGADFNILEYADPELEALTGEKTNILDSLDLVEPEPDKDDKKEIKSNVLCSKVPTAVVQRAQNIMPVMKEALCVPVSRSASNLPPPLVASQSQNVMHTQASSSGQQPLTPQQQIHQQMLQQVQQAAALGRPMAPGTKLMSPDGVIGIVTPTNNVSLTFPPNYQQRLLGNQLQLHNQKLQLRVGQNPRMLPVGNPNNQALHTNSVGLVQSRINVGAAPPPPPPYPGPPPPYPGSSSSQMGLRMGSPPIGQLRLPPGLIHPVHQQGLPMLPHLQRRPLLLEEQPLLLEELLEQEKREQEKQLQPTGGNPEVAPSNNDNESTLLSDHDFERLKADVFNSGTNLRTSPSQGGILPVTNQNRSFTASSSPASSTASQWQHNPPRPSPAQTPQSVPEVTPRVPTFNANLLPAPPLPPEHIVTEQDKHTQVVYEQWLNHQNNALTQQLRFYETEVQKLRKIRKSLNSKQRQLRKSGGQLSDTDAQELQRISAEQAILQKHLESSRKQSRQHGMLIQEYRNKQQAKQQRPSPGQSPIHHGNTPQSPMISPSASPMTQNSSPLHSPSPMVSHSPGPGSINSLIQSPVNHQNNMSPMQQPSPRIGTPLSQGDSSPGPAQSPSQVCLPPPAPRMTSPQHRRIVTSPVSYTSELRMGNAQALGQLRFARPPMDNVTQRVRLPSPNSGYQQRSSTPSPLNSPPMQQINITHQLLQKQLQNQALIQQNENQQNESSILHSQRTMQLLHQRQLFLRQQQLQQQGSAQQSQTLTPQQHQLMIQQQQQLAKQQQQQIAHLQAQSRLNQQSNQPPSSPMPPKSPLLGQVQQIMSPHSIHSQPASPMPPRSPMVSFGNQPPSSPMPRSPAVLHQATPSSPMMHHQTPSSPMPPRSPMISHNQSPMAVRRSPAMPERPTSVENPATPRTPQEANDMSGGGIMNPNNPIPLPPGFGRFGYMKLGLRGGSPMWGSFGRGKRVPLSESKEGEGEQAPPKVKKESHLSKVSILKKKSPAKTNLQSFAISNKLGSLVSSDYNDIDDSSSTPPVTPPPVASTSRQVVQKIIGKKLPEQESLVIDNSPGKHIRCDNLMDYDDDNDGAVVSTEVSLSSAAQQADSDDITVIETFSSQSDLTEVISSPLESGHIPDEFLLFPGNMVVDITSEEAHYSDKEDDEEDDYSNELVNIHDKNMHIVNVAIQSPTTSEEEMILQGKTKKMSSDSLTLNIVQGLSSDHLLAMTDTPESPEPEMNDDQGDDEMLSNYEDSEIVIIDPTVKSPEESISTKEDFEELIDEGSRKEKLIKPDVISAKHISEMHKYAASIFNFPQKSSGTTVTAVSTNLSQKGGTTPKISLIATPVSRTIPKLMTSDVVIAQTTKLVNSTAAPNITSIILPMKTSVRNNIINVPKLVTSSSPAITIVSASTSQIASILPSRFTVPVISASAVSKLTNVKVIDKPSTSLSLTAQDTTLPKKIFEDDSVSPDDSNCDDELPKDEKIANKDDNKLKESPKVDEKIITKLTLIDNSKEKSNSEIIVNKEPPLINQLPITKEAAKDSVDSKTVETNSTTSPVLIHTTPELKMTAQVIQEGQGGMQITARTVETMPASFITSQSLDGLEHNQSDLDTKSVVISIPSPTPSQEQMLDNIALQALENRRLDGKGIPGEFESFDDVLDMIENITGEPPTVLEDNIKDKLKIEPEVPPQAAPPEKVAVENKSKPQNPPRPPIMPQLSPLSQPTDLTTNMANVSQQLRTLLSNLHTTSTVTTASNVETTTKIVKEKLSNTSSSTGISTRIIPSSSDNNSTVIVPNIKPQNVVSPKRSPPVVTQATSTVIGTCSVVTTVNSNVFVTAANSNIFVTTANSNVFVTTTNSNVFVTTTNSNITTNSAMLVNRSVGGIQLMPDHPKLPPVTIVTASTHTTPSCFVTVQKTSVITSFIQSTPTARKTSLSLNAMLQSHPAATVPQTSPSTITTASILGSPIAISKTGFTTSLVQAQPSIMSVITSNTESSSAATMVRPSSVSSTTGTNLLHTQLTKVLRTKLPDEHPTEMIKKEDIKTEPLDYADSVNNAQMMQTTGSVILKQEVLSGCKYSTIQAPAPSRLEDSQNVLLKQLLQNTLCAVSQSQQQTSMTVPSSSPSTAPSLPLVPNLEAQLARPVPPTPTSLLPPILQNDSQPKTTSRTPIVTRETSFVSKPMSNAPTTPVTSQNLHIDIKKCLPPSRTPSRDDLLSPPTPRSSCSQDSSLQTPPLVIKKEVTSVPPHPSPVLTPHEVKKEFVDDSSQHSEVSDQSRGDMQLKEELMDCMEASTEKLLLDKEVLKKMKRRAYQQKRRQNQILNKEAAGQPKKRPRKSSKVDEDYDSYIDGVLAQIRTLPPMVVAEPVLNRNFAVVPVFGSGDLSKLGLKDYNSSHGDLTGSYGNAVVPGFSDFYNTKPYGDLDPLPEKPPASTQRGFYDQEFPLIRFDADDDKKFDLFCRDDSPDSVISSSSPECPFLEPPVKFPGLKLIDEDEDDEEVCANMRLSPVVPIIAPIPIRLKPSGPYLKDYLDMDKENTGTDFPNVKSKFAPSSNTPLKDSGNVTVTLTLTSSAAEDIMGVLRDLANILHIPAPTSYQIVERTSTPPSQKLGLYRTKGKDGKEGAPIDIQSILNGAAKFCRHCDVVILNNMIRKKVSELPFLSKDTELLGDGEELFFCSSTCYMQFALMHKSPSITEDKAAAIIDHLCQKDMQRSRIKFDKNDMFDKRKSILDVRNLSMKSRFDSIDFSRGSDFLKIKKQIATDCYSTGSVQRGLKYKYWGAGCIQPASRYKKPSDKEIMELLYRLGVTVTPVKVPEDTRKCMFCGGVGDGTADGPARLLNFDVDKWVHLNCGLWSDGVYETVNGALMNLENALQQSLVSTCVMCSKLGATIRCFKTRCSNIYHLGCAVKDGCVFFKNKTTYCTLHVPKNEKDNELTTLSVSRRVYVNRDENRQVAAVMHHSDTNNLLRVGSLIFLNVGQLLPHQLQNFHSTNYIYPIGYKIIRFYWSMRKLNKRCRYICSIHEVSGRPEFRILVQETSEDDLELRDVTPKAVWNKILEPLASMRRENQCLQVFPKFVTGEDLFGLTEPAVVRVLESLPGIETLTDYKFKYGRNPLLELPLAINPSGAARTEPKLKNLLHWKRPHTQRTGSSARPMFVPTTVGTAGEVACPYSKQFVHSKSSQYKKMKQEWRNNVYLARSKIQGLGLYAARDLEKHTMVIEYIGEIIRTELAETREKKYEAKNRGIYMFRLDEERVVDATLSGGLARYINHSCNPNCVAEIVEVDRDLRIIIFAKRRIQRGEELAYDYKFDIEDDQHKISCMCGAPNCRKWMN